MATILLVQNSTESNFRHKCHLRLNQEECQLPINLKGRMNNPEDKQVTAESSQALPPVQMVSGGARLSPLHRLGRQVRKWPAGGMAPAPASGRAAFRDGRFMSSRSDGSTSRHSGGEGTGWFSLSLQDIKGGLLKNESFYWSKKSLPPMLVTLENNTDQSFNHNKASAGKL